MARLLATLPPQFAPPFHLFRLSKPYPSSRGDADIKSFVARKPTMHVS